VNEDLSKYQPELLPEHLRWKGDGPPPASWEAKGKDGVTTKVYRSYSDYCDD
jgi:hypothetical protein